MMISRLLLLLGCSSTSLAFVSPSPSSAIHRVGESTTLMMHRASDDAESDAPRGINQKRREFLFQSLQYAALPFVAHADENEYLYQRSTSDEGGDMTTKLFNPDGSLRDPNSVKQAEERTISINFPSSSNVGDIVVNTSTDGTQPSSESAGLKSSYKIPTKWNNDQSSQLPLYYDSSEGKNGKSCNRITIYSIAAPKLDMSTLEKATKVGVAKSLFMDQLPNKYFDQGVLKADLISGRTTRKPIKSADVSGEGAYDEQVYYEFDLAFAPLECPTFTDGNKENLGLGFCPYDNIFLVSATVLDEGIMMVCVVECNKDEWKMANSDLRRVRSSFDVDRA